MNTFTKSLNTMLIVSMTFILVSCGGQKPMVSDIRVTPSNVDNDIYISVSADLSIGNLSLPAVSIPIFMPKTWQEIGSVQMTTGLGGKNQMAISLNLTAVSKLQAQTAQLPNGAMIPLIGNNRTIVIPVDNKVTIYVTLGDGQAALGVAIPFKTLDAMGAKVGTSSLFPVFNIKQVLGAAGIYTSKQAGKNGFGLFADISAVLSPVDFIELGSSSDLALDYNSIAPRASTESKINSELYKLNSARKALTLH